MKVKFHEARVVDDHRKGTKAEESYVGGKTYDLDEPSALHWIARGVAEAVVPRRNPGANAAPAEMSSTAPAVGAAAVAVSKPAVQS